MIISVIRSIILYAFVLFAIRIMGKRQLSDMQTSELVITMIIADIASIPMQNNSQSLMSGVIPILMLICAEIFISILMMKFPTFRNFMCGKPEIIIANGKLRQNILRKLRLTTEDLSVLLRQQGVFSISDVQYCIIETNGNISVLMKPEKMNPTMQDLSLTSRDAGIDAVVISDGELLSNSMALCGVDKKWIETTLNKENLKVSDVMMMTTNKLKEYSIIRKSDHE
ncbi:MAG: DUF421 domain-containing protein [Eubacteriales bacterium]|nr:DUF421 domain-containing protein [Eubacteriales bacterium]